MNAGATLEWNRERLARKETKTWEFIFSVELLEEVVGNSQDLSIGTAISTLSTRSNLLSQWHVSIRDISYKLHVRIK